MSSSLSFRTTEYRRRGGGLYLLVLSVSMLLMITGLSALVTVRIQRRGAEGGNDLAAAALYSQSAIELGMQWIATEPIWRTSRGEGFWISDRAVGEGKFSLEGNDLGAKKQLQASAGTDPVLLTGTGYKGDARYKLQVTMTAKSNALTCLQVAMHAGTSLTFNSVTVQSNLVTVSSNDSATANSAHVYPKVEAVTTPTGSTFHSGYTPGITPRTMPDATVFNYYTTNGTTIPYSSILQVSGQVTLEKKLLSPARNDYGTPNANGIYVINCAAGNLRIRDCRIVGTLVILNPGTFSIENSVLWEPAVANYPSLLVSGGATFNFTSTALSENSLGVNFNPADTPYQGAYNSNMLDTYPSVINGLVYVSGAVTTQSTVTINGVLVVGTTLTSQNNLNLTYLSTFYDNPPPGFSSAPQMVISPGTWKQLVD